MVGETTGAAGGEEHAIVVADAGQVTSALPVSWIPMLRVPFAYKVLLIVVLTVIGPQDVLLVEVLPILIPSRYRLTVELVNEPLSDPETDGELAETGPVMEPHLLAAVALTAAAFELFALTLQLPF